MTGSFDVVTVTFHPAIDRTITIPRFTVGAVNRVEDDRSSAGGKGVNVASALADHGYRVAVTGFLGREGSSSFDALCARKAIADDFVRIAGKTRTGIKIVDPALHQTTDINFMGPAPAEDDLRVLHEKLGGLDALCFVVAGSLPPGVDPAAFGAMVGALKQRDRKVIVDTSGEPLRHALMALPDVVKPNIHELEALLGASLADEAAVIAAARELVARGVRMVVVSMGGRGACFVTADGAVTARPPEVEVQSTVGAGDAMVAGLVVGELRGLSLVERARLATAFSVDLLTRSPDVAGSADEVEAWGLRVEVV